MQTFKNSIRGQHPSIEPTIHGINDILESFGFTGFSLAKSENDHSYKIQRSDGTDAKETLSEGEKTFITFLYFYHLLICRSLVSWVNDGSHFANDDLYVANDDSTVDNYLNVFKGIFDKTGHLGHYKMMMGEQQDLPS